MGIQRKPQKSLMELIEDQPRRGAPGKSTQPKLPPPPQPSLSSRPELADPKRKRGQKVKTWWRPGDLVQLVKTRLNELRSSKKLATHHNEA